MKNILYVLLLVALASCTNRLPEAEAVDQTPSIFPDYISVTIPPNIAPLNFRLQDAHEDGLAIIDCPEGNRHSGDAIFVKEKGGQFTISPSKWKRLLQKAKGKQIKVTVYAKQKGWIQYRPFAMQVAREKMDPFIVYRLIDPGYELWNQMGIYQYDIEHAKQYPVMENRLTDYNCMNCHSFCMQDPHRMLFHMRGVHGGTYLLQNDRIEKLNTKTDQTISALVYPSWHPSGRYVAFSVNDISQSFHQNHPNRIEVFDKTSDVVVYDTQAHTIYSDSLIRRSDSFETFPTFSPDGKTLYFCTAHAQSMPQNYAEIKYSICSIAFNPETHTFGTVVDTLYRAETLGKSASFPRISPNGKFLLFTLSEYGNFSIWHKKADLYMIHLETKRAVPLTNVNSNDVESYHSWSSNSHWIVFSSRRLDGLYTRPFFAYIDRDGNASKPFLLPQRKTAYYDRLMKSFNIPEFVLEKVENRMHEIAEMAANDSGINVKSDF